jgi:hypothetical protein
MTQTSITCCEIEQTLSIRVEISSARREVARTVGELIEKREQLRRRSIVSGPSVQQDVVTPDLCPAWLAQLIGRASAAQSPLAGVTSRSGVYAIDKREWLGENLLCGTPANGRQ